MTIGETDPAGEPSRELADALGHERRTSRSSRVLVRSVIGLLGLAYFITSAVVIVNAFVWLPSMPSAWYKVQHVLYWPFQPYFSLVSSLLGGDNVPYKVYAVVKWAPFVVVPIVGAVALVRGKRLKRSK